MERETVVSFHEIVSVDSIDDLVILYSERDLNFQDEEEFLNQLRSDWKLEVGKLEVQGRLMPIPQKLSSLDVTIDSTTYSIFGIIHGFGVPRWYKQLVSDAVNGRNNWLYEHWLGLFFKKENGAVEIPDSAANTFWYKIKEVYDPLEIVNDIVDGSRYIIKPSKSSEEDLKVLKEVLNVPLEAKGNLPAYVEIELRERNGKQYTSVQARSAYQAEFMRAYIPGEDKNLLVGATHAHETKHFLKSGVKNSRIVDLAHSHAEILMHNPKKYNQVLIRSKLKDGLAMASDAIADISPYIALFYLASYYINRSFK